MKHAIIIAAVLALAAADASAQGGPSFDCAKAQQEVEKAICRNERLSRLDREIAAAYLSARKLLDPAAQKALQEDQAGFLGTRDIALAWPDASLEDYMTTRLGFLRAIRPGAGQGDEAFLGEWKLDWGAITIGRGKAGRLKVSISTFAPVTARWVCEVEAEAALRGGRLSFVEDDVRITLSRSGALLKVVETTPPGRSARDYCGANGSVEGSYFKVR